MVVLDGFRTKRAYACACKTANQTQEPSARFADPLLSGQRGELAPRLV